MIDRAHIRFDLSRIDPGVTGIGIIDKQHKSLIETVREICALKDPLASPSGRLLIGRFHELQVAHDAVEHIMFRAVSSRKGRYPHTTAHLGGHMNFLLPLESVVKNIKNDKLEPKDTVRLFLVLNLFVAQHTDGSDEEYVRWYAKSGIKPAEVHDIIVDILRPGDSRDNILVF